MCMCVFFLSFLPSYFLSLSLSLSLSLFIFPYLCISSFPRTFSKWRSSPQPPEPRYLTGDNHSKPSLSQTHNGLFCSVPHNCLLYTYLLSTRIKYFHSCNYTLLCYSIQSFKDNYIWQVCEALKRKIRTKRPEWIETSISGPVDLSFVPVICDPVRGF